jgi:glycosyltransferase involved in cell wall biosynthesis
MRACPATELGVRVLLVSDVYFPRVNGVSTSIQTFRRDLAALGCDTWLIAPAYPVPWPDDSRVLRQPARYLPFDPEDRLMVGRAAERAALALRNEIDIVHIQTPFAAHRIGRKAARALGLAAVETYHTFFEEYFHHYLPVLPRGPLRGLARAISRRQCNAVNAVVAPSRQLAGVLEGYGVTSPIEVIPTGLDLTELRAGDGAAFRAAHDIPPERPMMLLVSRLAHEKNIGFIVDALELVRRSVPDVLLVLAGEGPALPGLRRKVASDGLSPHVRFVGYLDRRTALRDCYCAADVFVFASRTETQGLVLLEALALGVPVVSTAVLGTKEVLHGAGGALVVDEDRAAFARAVVEVLTNPERKRSLAAAAREHVEARWSSREMARRLLRFYERFAD